MFPELMVRFISCKFGFLAFYSILSSFSAIHIFFDYPFSCSVLMCLFDFCYRSNG